MACQFIRCTLHRLSANGIFIQIFQGHFGTLTHTHIYILNCQRNIPPGDQFPLSKPKVKPKLYLFSVDRQFFKVMASALADFNELNQLQPLTILFEDLNERKQLCREQTLHTLKNVATYLEALLLSAADGSLLQQWSTFLAQLDALLRRVILILATTQSQTASGGSTSGTSVTSLSCLLRIMTSVFKVPTFG